jgi:hypothetical protein
MDMGIAIVMMAMHVPALTAQLHSQATSQHDQQHSNSGLGNEFKLRRDVNS